MSIFKTPEQNQLISRDYIIYLRDFALSKGVQAKTLVGNSDTDLQMLLNPPAEISEVSFHQVNFNLFNSLENPYAGVIEFGKGMPLSMHGPLGIAIQGASNLREVSILARTFYRTRDNSRSLSFHENSTHGCISLTEGGNKYDTLSLLISFEYTTRNLLCDHNLVGQSIIHQTIKEPDNFPWELVQDYEIKFSQAQNQILVPIKWMTLAIKQIDPELATLAKYQCEQTMEALSSQNLVDIIRAKLDASLDKNISLKDMAQQLYVSPSTLQRRLKNFDTTYKQIKLEQRLNEAKRLLFDKQYTLERISEHLGFCDASSFTKSFKTFTGYTPSSYRGQHSDSNSLTSNNQ